MFRLANNVEIFFKPGSGEVVALKRGVAMQYDFTCDDNGRDFLAALRDNGGQCDPETMPARFQDSFSAFRDCGLLVSDPLPDMAHPLRSQHQTFSEWGGAPEATQKLIESAKVGLVGAGGMGAWVAIQLASMGVKRLFVVDPDSVEASNLARQPYGTGDIGRPKVEALRDFILQKSPDVELQSRQAWATPDSPYDSWFGDCDLVLIAGDHPSRAEMGRIVGRWASERRIPHHICGGYSGHNSALGLTVLPGKTPCWECYQEWYLTRISPLLRQNEPLLQGPRNPAGIMPIVMMAASASAYDAVRVLAGFPPALTGHRFDIFLDEHRFGNTPFPPAAGCAFCKGIAP